MTMPKTAKAQLTDLDQHVGSAGNWGSTDCLEVIARALVEIAASLKKLEARA